MAVDLRNVVTAERRRRGLSIRAAATLGNISNQAWGTWEGGEEPNPSPRMRLAVAKAFDWPTTWPENPPLVEPDRTTQRVAELEDDVRSLRRELTALRDAVIEMLGVQLPDGEESVGQR